MCEAIKKCSSEVDASFKFAKKTLQDYEVISVIGNGSFGTCFKVRDKETGELYAWKGIDYDELSESKKLSLVSEISVLRQLRHPNIVQYYHHLVNHEAKSIFIVMECCEGGDLAQVITKARVQHKRFEEKYIWRVLFQICRALQVCHNKIKQGTILHRDIKPANIFLDGEGNPKLGDFGLARMLRRNESFAETFVGTPYYMSPEIVKGSKYDRKSDVWAMGCLIYEMCALRPPFKGREFEQLSANISNGKFSSIPHIYSSDLQEIIAFMLEVDNDQRPSIEMITRHPTVIRNINDLGNEFPKLLEAERDFYVLAEGGETRCQLQFSPLTDVSSTTMFTDQNSFSEEYGRRCLSVSGVFTPDLRNELFYSAKRKIFPNRILQQSDPLLYESIRREDCGTVVEDTIKPLSAALECDKNPVVLTQNIFDQTLKQRLHAIRAQESLLKQRETNLNVREQQLNEKERRLQQFERNLCVKANAIEAGRKPPASRPSTLERTRLPLPELSSLHIPPPPIPPRKPIKHDDTYCTIEPNDTLLQQPTVAKLNLAALPATKAFPTLRKVTFRSPQKFIKYDIENAPPKPASKLSQSASTTNCQMRVSISSKGSDDSTDSTTHRRKSILSIFGLSRSNKDSTKTLFTGTKAPKVEPVVEKGESCKDLTNVWTKEHKRAAFDLLAAMNAAERVAEGGRHLPHTTRHKFRHSVRERNTLQRNRLRRSLIVAPPPIRAVGVHGRDQIVV